MHFIMKLLALVSIALFLASCQQSTTGSSAPSFPQDQLIIPPGFPQPVVPADNPITPAKIELGRDLFYETRLSFNNTKSCSSCHSVTASFSDSSNSVSTGVNGQQGTRNAPGLMNVAYDTTFFWDGRASSLEAQAGVPILNPSEMGSDSVTLVATLNNISYYREMFTEAFGGTNPITFTHITQAIATFERTLISGESSYDRYMQGDSSALSASAKNGLGLFNSSKTNCSKCHSGINFTDNTYHSTGLYVIYPDIGREDVTHNPADNGKFRTPSLRNAALTPPYMHDGSFGNFLAVINNYNVGGRQNATQDSLIHPLYLTPSDFNDLIAFLNSLTDTSFTERPDFQKPIIPN
jgi:cytochrome c peroxidase